MSSFGGYDFSLSRFKLICMYSTRSISRLDFLPTSWFFSLSSSPFFRVRIPVRVIVSVFAAFNAKSFVKYLNCGAFLSVSIEGTDKLD